MATTNLLLLEPIEKLGNEGEEVTVKAGYARNFLLPRNKAIPVTRANRKQIESLQKRKDERLARELDNAQRTAERIETMSIAIAVKTGPGGKLFGSVTPAQLIERLAEDGVELEKKQVKFEAIKTLGQHTANIKLHSDVSLDFNFEVVSENPIEELPSDDEAADYDDD